MAHRGRKKLIPLIIGVLGVAVGALLVVVTYGPLLRWWYVLQIERSEPAERWELARRYEESGGAARRAAEDWYLDVLRSWMPDEVAISQRDPSTGIYVRVPPTKDHHPPGSYHYPDEQDVAAAAARLSAMGSHRAIPLLVAHLERSNPELPFTDITGIRVSTGRAPSRSRFLCLHATSLALLKLRADSIDALIETMGSDKSNARIQAALTLSRLAEAGVADDRVRDALLAGYCDADLHLRSLGRGLLRNHASRWGTVDQSVLASVLECLRQNPSMAGDTARDLVLLGARGGAAGAALRAALLDETLPEKSRTALIGGLAGWVPTNVVESTLRDLLKDESRKVRMVTTHAIRNLVCRSPETIEALANALCSDAGPDVRHGAIAALKDLGKLANTARGEIWGAALEDPDMRVRALASRTLDELDGE